MIWSIVVMVLLQHDNAQVKDVICRSARYQTCRRHVNLIASDGLCYGDIC